MKNRRAVGLLNPLHDKNRRPRTGGGRSDDTCDHGLSGSWKVEVWEKKKSTLTDFVVINNSSLVTVGSLKDPTLKRYLRVFRVIQWRQKMTANRYHLQCADAQGNPIPTSKKPRRDPTRWLRVIYCNLGNDHTQRLRLQSKTRSKW